MVAVFVREQDAVEFLGFDSDLFQTRRSLICRALKPASMSRRQ